MDTEEVDHTAVIAPLVVVLLVVFLVRRHYQKPDYNHILTVGFSRFPFYYISAFNFLFNACKSLQEGCRRHDHAVFKIPDFVRWNVVITSPPLLEELRNAPEDKISFVDTHVCPGLSTNRAHSTLLSTKLTRTLPVVLGEMREEIISAFAETIPKVHVSSPPGIQAGQDNIPGEESMVALGDIPNVSDPPSNAPSSEEGRSDDADWTSVLGGDAMTEVVSRVCNRILLGPQLCQSPELFIFNKQYIRSAGMRSGLYAVLPPPLFRFATDIFGGVSWKARRLRKSLEDIIRQRREKPHKPEELPHNLLTSLLSSPSSNPRDIADALLTLNLQAVPSCALTLTNALHRFATCPPGVLKAMRFDVEGAVREEGWTMRALERMVTIDSFLKETMRVDKLHALTMRRTTRVPCTLSDGTYLPAGTSVSASDRATGSPPEFSALRFLPENGGAGPRYQLTTASPDFLVWGFGRGACPGRFVAGAVMKMVLAHIVVGYDVKEVCGELHLERRVLVRKRTRS